MPQVFKNNSSVNFLLLNKGYVVIYSIAYYFYFVLPARSFIQKSLEPLLRAVYRYGAYKGIVQVLWCHKLTFLQHIWPEDMKSFNRVVAFR